MTNINRPKDKVIVGPDGRLTLEWDAFFSRLESQVSSLGSGLTFPVAFMARPSSTQTIASGSYTKINFATEDFDTDGAFSSSRYTLKHAGKYLIIAQAAIDFSGGNGDIWINVRENGATDYSGNRLSNDASIYPNISVIVDADVGDYYEVFLYQSSVGNQDVITGRSYFGAFRLSV